MFNFRNPVTDPGILLNAAISRKTGGNFAHCGRCARQTSSTVSSLLSTKAFDVFEIERLCVLDSFGFFPAARLRAES